MYVCSGASARGLRPCVKGILKNSRSSMEIRQFRRKDHCWPWKRSLLESARKYAAGWWLLFFVRTDIRSRTNDPVKAFTTLVIRQSRKIIARIDCRTAGKECMGERATTVVRKRRQHRIAVNGIGESYVRCLDQIVGANQGLMV